MTESELGKGKRVLIIEPTGAAVSLITAARRHGFEVVVASFNRDDRRLPAEALAQVDVLATVDTNDEAALTEIATGLHAERPFAGVLPGFEFYVQTAARIADLLGTPGLPTATVSGLRDKAVMRATARKAGLRVPRFAEARDARQVAAASDLVGFPAVLKPAASAGSVHVSRVDDAAQLLHAYQWMGADSRTDLGRRLDGRVLLEEYISGPEVSVDGYVDKGRVVVVSVTAKMLGPEPYFVETGHIVQRDLDPALQETVERYVRAVCDALDLTLGPFHCELRLTDDGPVLIEIGARLPGGHIPRLVRLATGVSLPDIALAAYTGLPIDQFSAFGTPRVKYAAVRSFTVDDGRSTLTEAHGLDTLRGSPDVLEVELAVRPGDDLPLPGDFRSRIGHVIFHADSYPAAVQRWEDIQKGLRLV